MSVITLSQRAGRHPTQPPGPGHASGLPRRPGGAAQPAVTVTVALPLAGQTMSRQAHRLLEVISELVESGEGTVTIDRAMLHPAPPTPAAAAGSDGTPGPVGEPTGPAAPATSDPYEIRLFAGSRQVQLGGAPLPLTRLEFDLLLYLAQHPRRVFSRVQLLAGVWGYEHTGVRTVDVHVRRLRVKVGEHVPLVTTVYGVGYRLADDARVVVLPDQ